MSIRSQPASAARSSPTGSIAAAAASNGANSLRGHPRWVRAGWPLVALTLIIALVGLIIKWRRSLRTAKVGCARSQATACLVNLRPELGGWPARQAAAAAAAATRAAGTRAWPQAAPSPLQAGLQRAPPAISWGQRDLIHWMPPVGSRPGARAGGPLIAAAAASLAAPRPREAEAGARVATGERRAADRLRPPTRGRRSRSAGSPAACPLLSQLATR